MRKEVVKFRMETDDKEFLEKNGKKNGRNFAGECRFGLQQWIAHIKKKEAKQQ